jgi:hypothetical protein
LICAQNRPTFASNFDPPKELENASKGVFHGF